MWTGTRLLRYALIIIVIAVIIISFWHFYSLSLCRLHILCQTGVGYAGIPCRPVLYTSSEFSWMVVYVHGTQLELLGLIYHLTLFHVDIISSSIHHEYRIV